MFYAEDYRIGLGEQGAQSYELDPYMGAGLPSGATRKMIPYAISPFQTPVGVRACPHLLSVVYQLESLSALVESSRQENISFAEGARIWMGS